MPLHGTKYSRTVPTWRYLSTQSSYTRKKIEIHGQGNYRFLLSLRWEICARARGMSGNQRRKSRMHLDCVASQKFCRFLATPIALKYSIPNFSNQQLYPVQRGEAIYNTNEVLEYSDNPIKVVHQIQGFTIDGTLNCKDAVSSEKSFSKQNSCKLQSLCAQRF